MRGVGRAATLAAAPTERSWRRVSSLVIVGSRPCSVAPVASGGRGALRPAHVVVFRGLSLAAGTIPTDSTCAYRKLHSACNATLLHPDRLVSAPFSFGFLNVADFKGICAG